MKAALTGAALAACAIPASADDLHLRVLERLRPMPKDVVSDLTIHADGPTLNLEGGAFASFVFRGPLDRTVTVDARGCETGGAIHAGDSTTTYEVQPAACFDFSAVGTVTTRCGAGARRYPFTQQVTRGDATTVSFRIAGTALRLQLDDNDSHGSLEQNGTPVLALTAEPPQRITLPMVMVAVSYLGLSCRPSPSARLRPERLSSGADASKTKQAG